MNKSRSAGNSGTSCGALLLHKKRLWKKVFGYWEIYLFLVPLLLYMIFFEYAPMYGIQIAFKDFKPHLGIWGSPWVGLKHFERFIKMPMFTAILKNTLVLSIYGLVASFPFPIILALALNSCTGKRFSKLVQNVTYAPHFISVVVLVSMINLFFSPNMGLVGNLLRGMGIIDGPLMILTSASAFPHLYVWSSIWQGMGWSSIIYLSALSGVDPGLHEAAIVDGANKFQRVLYIDLPSIMPTIVILLILDCGKVMSVGFEKSFLMQNALNMEAAEIINTYVYKVGLKEGQYSLSTAIGLFNSIINYIMIVTVNWISKKVGQASLW